MYSSVRSGQVSDRAQKLTHLSTCHLIQKLFLGSDFHLYVKIVLLQLVLF